MRFLLVLHSEKDPGSGCVVVVPTKSLADKVNFLLEKNKSREAFNLLMKKGVPESYVPAGQRVDEYFTTLVEDDLL